MWIGIEYDIEIIDIGVLIVCDGVCLIVIVLGSELCNWFDVEISVESVEKINIGWNKWYVGKWFNLECVLKVGDELGGYIVLGYVDGVVDLIELWDEGDSICMMFKVFDGLVKFIVFKGLVVLNGILLIVNEVNGDIFGINVILYMKIVMIWGDIKEGDVINLEVDIMVCYVVCL